MQKLQILKITNAILFLAALTQFGTGFFLFFVPQGDVVELAGEIHEWNGFILGLLVMLHLWLNWTVIKSHYFVHKGGKSV